jgi:hypothetical protein
MSIVDAILGKPVASSDSEKQELTVWTGVPVLGLDALASTSYGPEGALTVLAATGVAGVHYLPLIIILVVVQLSLLYISYRQTAACRFGRKKWGHWSETVSRWTLCRKRGRFPTANAPRAGALAVSELCQNPTFSFSSSYL